jgi:hypothetical protein
VLSALAAILFPAFTSPSIAQILQTGTLVGVVTDAAGRPVSGVQIRVTDAAILDVTDASGRFSIVGMSPGPHTVEATLVGYKPVQANSVFITQDLTTNITLMLLERSVAASGIQTVTVPMVHRNVTPTLYTVTSREEDLVRGQPVNLYQYPGAAISQPGVVPDADGFPTIRGSRRLNVGYMLDGILLSQPSSGEFSTNLVTVGMDRMNVYTGGYRAEMGGAMGGFINATVKTGASMRGAAVETATGSWGFANIVYEQGNVEKNGFNWYVSGNAYRTGLEKNPAWSDIPVSADFIAKAIQPFGKNDRVTLLYTNGYARQSVPLNDPSTGRPWSGGTPIHTLEFRDATDSWANVAPTQDYLNQGHSIGSLTWAHSLSAARNLSAQVYGWDRSHAVNAESDFDGFWDSKLHDRLAAGRLDYTDQTHAGLAFRGGAELIAGSNWDRLARYGEPDSTPGAYLRIRDANTTDLNGFLTVTAKPTERLTADLGARYDSRTYHRQITDAEIAMGRSSTNPTKDVLGADLAVLAHTGRNPKYDAVSPRVGMAYSANPATVFKASAGRYVQFAPADYIENIYIPITDADGGGNPNYYPLKSRKVFDVKPEKVDSLDVGVERQIGSSTSLAVTPFLRHITDMIDRGPAVGYDGSAVAGPAFSNLAHGHSKGVESKLTLRERKGFSGWITYTYQVAKANAVGSAIGNGYVDVDRPDDEFRMDYDQRHTLYVVGSYRHASFEFNPMLEYGSGYPYGQVGDGEQGGSYAVSPVTGADLPILVDGKLQSTSPQPYNTGRHMNLSATFRHYTDEKKTSYYFVQIQNILNSQDVTARAWQNPYTGSNAQGYVPGPTTYVDENGKTVTNVEGHFEYKPWTRVPPVFVLVGVRRAF